MKVDLDVFTPGITQVGELVRVKVILRNGGEMGFVDEAKRLKFTQKLFTLIINGRFNYVRLSRFAISSISVNIVEVTTSERPSRKTPGKGDGQKG